MEVNQCLEISQMINKTCFGMVRWIGLTMWVYLYALFLVHDAMVVRLIWSEKAKKR